MLSTAHCTFGVDKRQMQNVPWPASATDGKRYLYLYDTDDFVLKTGDQAVVDSPYGGPTVVSVVSVQEGEHRLASKWVIDRIDTDKHDARREQRQRLKAVTGQLEDMLKERKRRLDFEVLKDDPVAQALLDELNKLTGKASA